MVSMSPSDVRDRLGDRFRLLSGARRGLQRHQTLRHAVQWSYELLTDDERVVLQHASVFTDGFDLAAITHLCEHFDEYTMLDHVDSLVRKSLVTAQQSGDHNRYGLLETIRQFADEQLAATVTISDIRDRHARYYAAQAITYWDLWEGPGYDEACDWVDAEFANLRAGFRWATDRADLETATTIAAHTTMLAHVLQQFEPVRWAEELLPAAIAADIAQLPQLYVAASNCTSLGRPDDAVGYTQAASALLDRPGHQHFDSAWVSYREASAHLSAGRLDRHAEICAAMANQTGLARVIGLCVLTNSLVAFVGRSDEMMAIAEDAIVAARVHANPLWNAVAYAGYGLAFSETDPTRALDTYRLGLAYTRQHRLPRIQALTAVNAAGLEAVHGDLDQALNLFILTIDSFHQAGNATELAHTFANLAVLFDRIDRPETAAILYGTAHNHPSYNRIIGVAAAVDHVRNILSTDTFDRCVATGVAMEPVEAVRYARPQIELLRSELAASP